MIGEVKDIRCSVGTTSYVIQMKCHAEGLWQTDGRIRMLLLKETLQCDSIYQGRSPLQDHTPLSGNDFSVLVLHSREGDTWNINGVSVL